MSVNGSYVPASDAETSVVSLLDFEGFEGLHVFWVGLNSFGAG